MSKVTRWFPPECKPVHIGSYETRRTDCSPSIVVMWWDGNQWLFDMRTHEKPVWVSADRSAYQNRPWRGLKEKPE